MVKISYNKEENINFGSSSYTPDLHQQPLTHITLTITHNYSPSITGVN